MSSVRTRYCGHSFSSEFTCVIPTEPYKLPSPDSPRCFAPQGTDCMLSSMPLGATFFFLALAVMGKVQASARVIVTADMTFIDPPCMHSPLRTHCRWNQTTVHGKRLGRAGAKEVRLPCCRFAGYRIGGLGVGGVAVFAVPVAPVVVPPIVTFVVVAGVAGCCTVFMKLCGF